MKPVFCPKCRKRITPPKMFNNIKMAEGSMIQLKCGDSNCNGVAKIKG